MRPLTAAGVAVAGSLLVGGGVLGAGGGADARPVSHAAVTAAVRQIAITYDDLPANSYLGTTAAFISVTGPLVSGLAGRGIPAIGFVNEGKLYPGGDLDSARVDLLRAWIDAGLDLGNHSYSHPDLHSTPLEEYQVDVLRGEREIRDLLATVGREPRFFRHPFLHTGGSLRIRKDFEAFLAEHGYRVAPVTIDNQEWIFARAYDHAQVRGDATLAGRIAGAYLAYMDAIVGYYEDQSRALLGYEVPQVLLLHANQLNADVLDLFFDNLERRGYEFISLETALEDPAYDLEDEYVGPAGITWLHRWALTEGKRGSFFSGEPEPPAFVQEVFDDPPPRPGRRTTASVLHQASAADAYGKHEPSP